LRRRVSAELPLLIDLLRLLQGVGFSMDQSLQTLGDKLRSAIPVLGREIQQANIAYMHGRSRQQSLRRLAESFGDEDLRSLVQLMLQVHEHGGAVQEPLRQFSVRLREQRRSALKEKVGKLSVKMTIVMMLTLLPALMLVLSGPAIIALANAVNRLG
jgi:tight adherence protein C